MLLPRPAHDQRQRSPHRNPAATSSLSNSASCTSIRRADSTTTPCGAPTSGGYEFTDAQGHFVAWPELTTEVLTVVRLIDEHGWPAHLIKMEHTPFDVCTFATEDMAAPVVIATEEKHSPDQARTLLTQLRSFARRRLQPDDRAQLAPSERQDFPKYLGLCGLNSNGDPLNAPEWFVVAAPTVWRAFRVSQLVDHAALEETDPGDMPRGD